MYAEYNFERVSFAPDKNQHASRSTHLGNAQPVVLNGAYGGTTSLVVSSEPREKASNPSASPLEVNVVVLVSPDISQVSILKARGRSSPR